MTRTTQRGAQRTDGEYLRFGEIMIWRPTLHSLLAVLTTAVTVLAQDTTRALSDVEMEAFLQRASVVRTKVAAQPGTLHAGTLRATLTAGELTHDAFIHPGDPAPVPLPTGTEPHLGDSSMYSVAAYRLDRLIGLRMLPVAVARRYQSRSASFAWWVDDVIMDEGARLQKRIAPPDPTAWNEQIELINLFDALIDNIDRKPHNLLITEDWRVWAVDHRRSFGTDRTLKAPERIARCDRLVLERLRQLNAAAVTSTMGEFLTWYQIEALFARRDAIITLLEQRGVDAVFDRRVQ